MYPYRNRGFPFQVRFVGAEDEFRLEGLNGRHSEIFMVLYEFLIKDISLGICFTSLFLSFFALGFFLTHFGFLYL